MQIQVVRSHLVCNDANKHGNSRNGVYDDLFSVKSLNLAQTKQMYVNRLNYRKKLDYW